MDVRANTPFEATVTNAPSGLVGTITVEIYDPTNGATIVAPTTAGITQTRPGSYTAQLTCPVAGTFAVRWVLPTGGSAEESLNVGQGFGDLAVPSATDVATLLRARTKDLTGHEIGVFTADTRPTAAEVDGLIAQAYAEVTGQSGTLLHPRCAGAATALIVIRAAMWVELSYFPEQVRSDRSVYQELAEQFTAGMPGLLACVEGNVPGAEDGDTGAHLRFGMLDVHGLTSVAGPFGTPRHYPGFTDAL